MSSIIEEINITLLNKILAHSEALYRQIDYSRINIASPRRILSWGYRRTPQILTREIRRRLKAYYIEIIIKNELHETDERVDNTYNRIGKTEIEQESNLKKYLEEKYDEENEDSTNEYEIYNKNYNNIDKKILLNNTNNFRVNKHKINKDILYALIHKDKFHISKDNDDQNYYLYGSYEYKKNKYESKKDNSEKLSYIKNIDIIYENKKNEYITNNSYYQDSLNINYYEEERLKKRRIWIKEKKEWLLKEKNQLNLEKKQLINDKDFLLEYILEEKTKLKQLIIGTKNKKKIEEIKNLKKLDIINKKNSLIKKEKSLILKEKYLDQQEEEFFLILGIKEYPNRKNDFNRIIAISSNDRDQEIEYPESYDFKNTHIFDYIGEIRYANTIDKQSNMPFFKGLFCPITFGPITSWQCFCGKYRVIKKQIRSFQPKFCEICWVEITDSRVRRYRMGFYFLKIPIAHIWYFNARPNYYKIFLKFLDPIQNIYKHIRDEFLLETIYNYDQDLDTKNPFNIYTQQQYRKNESSYRQEILKTNFFSSATYASYRYFAKEIKKTFVDIFEKIPRQGCELIEARFIEMDLLEEIKMDRKTDLFTSMNEVLNNLKRHKLALRRIRIFESFISTKTKLIWTLLTILPILPPGLRILLANKNSNYEQELTSTLNKFYQNIINYNEPLLYPRAFSYTYSFQSKNKELKLAVPMLRSQVQQINGHYNFVPLQIAIDQLIDNARTNEPKFDQTGKILAISLTERLEGKEGRFRLNLFGKRINYSARSIIIVGPYLRMDQCAIPYQISLTLFTPLILRKILELQKLLKNKDALHLANMLIRLRIPKLYDLVYLLGKEYSVILNRAPTLHKFGIQSFQPIISLSKAIELHPLVCTGFNADFDGDQMGLYLPFFKLSQLEMSNFLRSSSNIFSPTNGDPILKFTQDMIIGMYYLTSMIAEEKDFCSEYFSTLEQVILRYYQKKIFIHTRILVNFFFKKEYFEIENNDLFFFSNSLPFLRKKIYIKKIFHSQGNFSYNNIEKKSYIFTNIGILVAHRVSESIYEISNLLLETTPGRVLFNETITTAILIGRLFEKKSKSIYSKI